jgi:hypothetical protein
MHSLAADLARFLDPLAVAHDLRIDPDPWQQDLITSTDDRILINASRQVGKSTTTAVVAVNEALDDPGLIIVASPSLQQSGELFLKIKETLKAIKPTVEFEDESARRLRLSNGSRIVALSGNESTARGYSGPKLILIDEASRVSDDLHAALTPMLAASGGRLIALSTPNGRQGWFFHAWQDGGDRWRRFRVPATECPRISAAFLEEQLREMGPTRFASEFNCEFIDGDEAYFSSKLIEAAMTNEYQPLWN